MIKISHIAAVCGAALLATATAGAGTVDVKYVGKGKGSDVRIHFDGKSQNVFAGQLKHELSNGTGGAAGLSGTFITYCTDIYEYVSTSKRQYELSPLHVAPDKQPMGMTRASAILDLYQFAAGQQMGDSANKDFAAAFQIAIWEVVHDFDESAGRSSLDVATGEFRATKTGGGALSGAIFGHLNNLFNAIGNVDRSASDRPSLGALRNDGFQDQIVMLPLPTGAALAFAGIAGLAARRRRAM